MMGCNKLRDGLSLLLFFLLALSQWSCSPNHIGKADHGPRYSLVFEEYLFGQPIGKYFKIDTDVDNETYGSISVTPQVQCIDANLAAIEQLIPNEKRYEVYRSSDGKWLSVHCWTKENNYKGEVPIAFLIARDGTNFRVAKEFPAFTSRGYFSDKSDLCYFQTNWKIFEMNLLNYETKEIAEGSTFFKNSQNGKLITFNNETNWNRINWTGRIVEVDPNNYSKRDIGEYKEVAIDSGLIDGQWGYFITDWIGKAEHKSNLFFFNLKTYVVHRYPHSFRNSRLICVQKESE